MTFQREQRGAQHQYLSRIRKREWQHRFFKQFLDEQIKACEIQNNIARLGNGGTGSGEVNSTTE
jgi:hypothetical protein